MDNRVAIFLGQNLGLDSGRIHEFLDDTGAVGDAFSLGRYAGLSEKHAEVSEERLLVFLDVVEGLFQALFFHGAFDGKSVLIASSRKPLLELAFPL
jgi:hypothetical protein